MEVPKGFATKQFVLKWNNSADYSDSFCGVTKSVNSWKIKLNFIFYGKCKVYLDWVGTHSQIFKILTYFLVSELSKLLIETAQMFLTISWIPLNLYGLCFPKWLCNYINP